MTLLPLLCILWLPQPDDASAIRAVIASANVAGMHAERDASKVLAGCHPDFEMLSMEGDGLHRVDLEAWINVLERGFPSRPPQVDHRVVWIDTTADTAAAKVEIDYNGHHQFTEYLNFVRMPAGWKIISKTVQPVNG